MKVKINSKHKNSLMNREEMEFEASDFEKTPSRKEIRERIVAEIGAKPELVVIGKTRQAFGHKKMVGIATAYSDLDSLKRLEQAYLINRTEGKKGKKGVQEEKPEKKEEAKEEKK